MSEADVRPIEPGDPLTRSADVVEENVQWLIETFGEAFPEAFSEDGIDFDVLRQLLGGEVVEGDEKYGLNWHGKRDARRIALTPSTGTLRPCPEESVDWDTTQNLMIEGDNLEVLKLLQKSYSGKVKLIYIDPPYNTGKDFVYKDDYGDNIGNYLELTGQVDGEGRKLSSNVESSGRFHTDWLNMMYPRLKLARNLLRDDGIIAISIDDNELQNLLSLCDEVFGEESFVGILTWRTTTQPDNIGRARFGVQQNIEYVVVYSRCSRLDLPPFVLESSGAEPAYPHTGRFGSCRLEIIERAFEGAYARPTMRYKILGQYPREGKQWQIGEETARDLESRGRVEIVDGVVKRAVYPEDEKGDARGLAPFWAFLNDVETTQRGKKELTDLLGRPHGIDTVKPTSLVSRLLRHLPKDAVVLDFFAGSGTTGHAVMKSNAADSGMRRFVLVQLPEPLDPTNPRQRTAAEFCDSVGRPRSISEIAKERLGRAGAKVREENPLFSGDVGFRVFKLDSSNIRAWSGDAIEVEESLLSSLDHVVEGRTDEDLLYEVLLKLGLDLAVPIEEREIAGVSVSAVGGGVLLACLAESLPTSDVEGIGTGIATWLEELDPVGDVTVVFRDSAFEDDVAKTNMAAILEQAGVTTIRSI